MANSSMFVLPRKIGAGRAQPSDHGRVVGRDEMLQDARGAGGAHALRAEHVLDRQRNAGQRAKRLALARAAGQSRSASRKASWSVTVTNARTRPSTSSMRSRCARVNSTAEISRRASDSLASLMLNRHKSATRLPLSHRECFVQIIRLPAPRVPGNSHPLALAHWRATPRLDPRARHIRRHNIHRGNTFALASVALVSASLMTLICSRILESCAASRSRSSSVSASRASRAT